MLKTIHFVAVLVMCLSVGNILVAHGIMDDPPGNETPAAFPTVNVKVLVHWFNEQAWDINGPDAEMVKVLETRIAPQINLLNQGFASAGVTFQLAAGVGSEVGGVGKQGVFFNVHSTDFGSLEEMEAIEAPLDTRQYLNLYVGKLNGTGPSHGAAGETIERPYYSPGYSNGQKFGDLAEAVCVGISSFYDLDVLGQPTVSGGVAIHEVGHWFRLNDAWGSLHCSDDPEGLLTYMNITYPSEGHRASDVCGNHFSPLQIDTIRTNIRRVRPWLHGYTVQIDVDAGEGMQQLASRTAIAYDAPDMQVDYPFPLDAGMSLFWPRRDDAYERAYPRTFTVPDQTFAGDPRKWALAKWTTTYTAIPQVNNNPWNTSPPGNGTYRARVGHRYSIVLNPVTGLESEGYGNYNVSGDHKPVGESSPTPDGTYYYVQNADVGVTVDARGSTSNTFFYKWTESAGMNPWTNPIENFKPQDDVVLSALVKEHLKSTSAEATGGSNRRTVAMVGPIAYMVYESAGWIHLCRSGANGWEHEIPIASTGNAKNPSIAISSILGEPRVNIVWEEVSSGGTHQYHNVMFAYRTVGDPNTLLSSLGWTVENLTNSGEDMSIDVDAEPSISSTTTETPGASTYPTILWRRGNGHLSGGLVRYIASGTPSRSHPVTDPMLGQPAGTAANGSYAFFKTTDPALGSVIRAYDNGVQRIISGNLHDADHPSVAANPAVDGEILAVFDAKNQSGVRHVYFCQRSAAGDWTAPSELEPGSSLTGQRPVIGTDGQVVTALWERVDEEGQTAIVRDTKAVNAAFSGSGVLVAIGHSPQVTPCAGTSGQFYSVWVSGGQSPYSINTAPYDGLAVSPSTPANNETGSPTIVFSWTGAALAASYELQVSTNEQFTSVQGSWTGSATTHTLDLNCAETYYWRVRALPSSGAPGEFSPVYTYHATGAPRLLSPQHGATVDTPFNLEWHNVPCGYSYILHVYDASGTEVINEEVEPGSGETTAYSVQQLSMNAHYTWQVETETHLLPTPVVLSDIYAFTTGSHPLVAQAAFVSGWNLVSVPLAGTGFAPLDIYPGATSAPYGYFHGYTVPELLVPGSGYWLKFPASRTVDFRGSSLAHQSVQLYSGWNLVGSLSDQLPIDNIVPPMPLSSEFYDYVNGSYVGAPNIQPGRGYWVKSSADQVIALDLHTQGTGGHVHIETAPPCGPDTTVPIPPTLLYPVSGSDWQPATLKFYWTPGRCQGIYQFQLATTPNFNSGMVTSTFLTAESIQVSGLISGTQYYWRVRDSIPPLISGWSTVNSVRAAAPPTPTLIFPANSSTYQPLSPSLGWGSAGGAVKYQIQVSNGSGTVLLDDSSLTGLTKTLNNLSMGTNYTWKVRASNGSWWSAWTSAWAFTTGAPPAQPALVFPAANAVSTLADITFRWNTVPGTTNYRLQVSTSAAFNGLTVDDSTLTDTSRLVQTLQNLYTYYWRVNASNAFGTGVWSGIRSFTVGVPPAAPTLSSPANASTNIAINPTLSWTAVSGNTNYRLQLSKQAGFDTIALDYDNYTSTSKQTDYLDGNTRYYWRVCARNVGGTSAWSTAWYFNTQASPVPPAPTPSAPANNATNIGIGGTPLIWNAALYATSYRVQAATSSNFASGMVLNHVQSELTYNDWDLLQASTTYYWRVQAINVSGTSSWSTTWQFTVTAGGGGCGGSLMAESSQMDAVTVTDAAGMSQTLYFYNGMDSLSQELNRANEMPPEPVKGAFSVRFESGKFFESLHPDKGRKSLPHIRVKGAKFPVTMDWDIKDRNKMDYWMPHPDNRRNRIRLHRRGRVGINQQESSGSVVLALDAEANSTCGPPPDPEKAVHRAIDDGNNDALPKVFSLAQNVPNPFNPSTVINYELPVDAKVDLKVYNMLGQEVAVLADQVESAGYHAVTFNASNVASGVYFYRFKAEQVNAVTPQIYSKIIKMVVLK